MVQDSAGERDGKPTPRGDEPERRRGWWDDVSRHPLLLAVAAGLLGSGGLVTWGVQQLVSGDGTAASAPATTTATVTATVTASQPVSPSSPGGTAPASGSSGPATSAQDTSGFTLQFGPQALNIGQVDLQAAPPVVSAPGSSTDVSTYWRTADGRAELQGSSGAKSAMWTEAASPTAQQCSDLATTVPDPDLAVAAGDRVCVAMEDFEGRAHVALLEITEVTGATSGQGRVVATVTVWRKD